MKRILFIVLLFLVPILSGTPVKTVFYIQQPEAINYYDALIHAVTWVESKHGLHVWNPLEEAVGWFQIRPIRLQDYNERTGKNYTMQDCFDYNISKEIFLYFAQGKSYEQAAKNWNGSGPMTLVYWYSVSVKL